MATGCLGCFMDTYNNIKGINAVLDAIDEAEGSIEEKELVKARALALRGYYYLMLVNVFGEPYNLNKNGMGVVMKRTAVVAENGIARSTVEECYNYIISDFKEAITLFKKYPKTKNQFLNITATNILLSRAYLYMENWEEAAKAATEAINTPTKMLSRGCFSLIAKKLLHVANPCV